MTLTITLVGGHALIVVLIARNRAKMAAWLSKSAERARSRIILFVPRLRRMVNRWVAATIAHHERRAAKIALRQLDDRELKDLGIFRCQIDDVIERGRNRGCASRAASDGPTINR